MRIVAAPPEPLLDSAHEKAVLHLASERGLVETVRFLLERFGADANTLDSANQTALHCALMRKHDHRRMRPKQDFELMVDLLLKKGGRVNQQNTKGETALHLAARHQWHHVADMLHIAGADVKLKNSRDETPEEVIPDFDLPMKQVFAKYAPLSSPYLQNSPILGSRPRLVPETKATVEYHSSAEIKQQYQSAVVSAPHLTASQNSLHAPNSLYPDLSSQESIMAATATQNSVVATQNAINSLNLTPSQTAINRAQGSTLTVDNSQITITANRASAPARAPSPSPARAPSPVLITPAPAQIVSNPIPSAHPNSNPIHPCAPSSPIMKTQKLHFTLSRPPPFFSSFNATGVGVPDGYIQSSTGYVPSATGPEVTTKYAPILSNSESSVGVPRNRRLKGKKVMF